MMSEERIAALEAENARLREQLTVMPARVQELEARLAKDSHNSGKPSSSDELRPAADPWVTALHRIFCDSWLGTVLRVRITQVRFVVNTLCHALLSTTLWRDPELSVHSSDGRS